MSNLTKKGAKQHKRKPLKASAAQATVQTDICITPGTLMISVSQGVGTESSEQRVLILLQLNGGELCGESAVLKLIGSTGFDKS